MTKENIRVGDRFRLGEWVWRVDAVFQDGHVKNSPWFRASDEREDPLQRYRRIDLKMEDADSLNWLET